jgi:hypothetical protein
MIVNTEKINLHPWALTDDRWICLVICEETGIVYHHSCGSGAYVLPNQTEGFAIPISSRKLEEQLYGFFEKFEPFSPYGSEWIQKDKDELSVIINKIVIYRDQFQSSGDIWVWGEWIVSFLSNDVQLFQYKDGKVVCSWESEEDKNRIEYFNLELDLERWNEAVAGWIPVKTGFGPGVLMFENYD